MAWTNLKYSGSCLDYSEYNSMVSSICHKGSEYRSLVMPFGLSSATISGGTVLSDLFKLYPQTRAGSTPTIGEVWMSGTSTVVGGLYCCTGVKWLKVSLT